MSDQLALWSDKAYTAIKKLAISIPVISVAFKKVYISQSLV